jgi:hypothetical protein
MTATPEAWGKEIRAALAAAPGREGRLAVCDILARILRDTAFVERYVTAEQCKPRKVLYEDPEFGFCICGHVYDGAADGNPHDHGSTWAIYGVASGDTEMTDWQIVTQGSGEAPTLVEPVRTYLMQPGDCHLYDTGDVHSPRRRGPTRLVRIEGKNLDRVKRTSIKAA